MLSWPITWGSNITWEGALLHSNRKRKSVCRTNVLKLYLSTKALQLQCVLLRLLHVILWCWVNQKQIPCLWGIWQIPKCGVIWSPLWPKSACADIISSEDNLPIFTITIIKPLICVMISVWKATNRWSSMNIGLIRPNGPLCSSR